MPRVFDEVASKDEATLNEIGLTRSDIDTAKAGGKINISGRPYVTKDEATLRAIGLSRSDFTESGVEEGGGDSPPTVTNAEKLALPVDTPVGTEVVVTNAVLGFYDGVLLQFPFVAQIATHNSKPYFENDFGGSGEFMIEWQTNQWSLHYADANVEINATNSSDTPMPPASGWTDPLVLLVTPVTQELASPGSDILAMSFLGIGYDGLYQKSSEFTANGRNLWLPLGGILSTRVVFYTGTHWANGDWDYGDTGSLASNDDLNAANGSEANPGSADWSAAGAAVANVTSGELSAGVTYGDSIFMNDGQNIPDFNGRHVYRGLGVKDGKYLVSASGKWRETNTVDDSGTVIKESDSDTAFPWQSAWTSAAIGSVTRNDVASESNWEVVP